MTPWRVIKAILRHGIGKRCRTPFGSPPDGIPHAESDGRFAGSRRFTLYRVIGTELREIVVTAAKREERLQEVPISIAAICGANGSARNP